MIRRIRRTEHHAVEASVILKSMQLGKAETLFVKPSDCFEIIRRACDPQFTFTKHIVTLQSSSEKSCYDTVVLPLTVESHD